MPSNVTGRRLRPAVLLTTVLLTAAVTGCGSSGDSPTAAPSPSATPTVSADAPAGVLGIRDPWVKAADKGMTAAFATLVNDSEADVTLTSVTSEVSPMELHEMAMKDGEMVMQAKQGGIVVKAKSSHVLEPGGDHLMLLDLQQPVKAGDELAFTLAFADGRTQSFTAVAKPFTGAQESYDPGHSMPDMSMSPSPAS
ncbi:copper chaperone PCu(A)C [Salinispora arenicola]|uniref:copper chaperone PCu(A)C n=1 Tax=Salinispora arenicola TaxID=168697 RepID=UPI0002F99CC0|nr:copper chaperone PCu(A)C [Salinispora arenicola]MCN0177139.1 copper chaperone PCu(A)C [Salinispora arenicola]NIL59771.1 copper chaperone PCu(A)C [Salinispora arenicola]NIL61048.1 copper chaperone PCu(A)C [Salinispora arenicola]